MGIIRADFSKSASKDLEEQIEMALMMAIKNSGDVVAWAHSGNDDSFCIVYNREFMRLSMSRTSNDMELRTIEIMEQSFGKPRRIFSKESSINLGEFILYMEWDSEVCNEILTIIS